MEAKGELGRREGVRLLLCGKVMLKPMLGAPASLAPRLAASMMPGPPPVAMTFSRTAPCGLSAPPRSEAMRPKRRACAYQRGLPARPVLAHPGAAEESTSVERTEKARSASSALAYSMRKRTPRIKSPMRESWSSAGMR